MPAGLPTLAPAGGAIAAVFLMLSALCYRTLADPAVARDASLAHALVVLSYLAGGPAFGVPLVPTVGVVATATLREQILPRWTGWLGAVTAVVGATCVSTFLGPTNNHSVTYGILLLGAVLMFAWLVVTSIALIVRSRHESPSRADPSNETPEKERHTPLLDSVPLPPSDAAAQVPAKPS